MFDAALKSDPCLNISELQPAAAATFAFNVTVCAAAPPEKLAALAALLTVRYNFGGTHLACRVLDAAGRQARPLPVRNGRHALQLAGAALQGNSYFVRTAVTQPLPCLELYWVREGGRLCGRQSEAGQSRRQQTRGYPPAPALTCATSAGSTACFLSSPRQVVVQPSIVQLWADNLADLYGGCRWRRRAWLGCREAGAGRSASRARALHGLPSGRRWPAARCRQLAHSLGEGQQRDACPACPIAAGNINLLAADVLGRVLGLEARGVRATTLKFGELQAHSSGGGQGDSGRGGSSSSQEGGGGSQLHSPQPVLPEQEQRREGSALLLWPSRPQQSSRRMLGAAGAGGSWRCWVAGAARRLGGERLVWKLQRWVLP